MLASLVLVLAVAVLVAGLWAARGMRSRHRDTRAAALSGELDNAELEALEVHGDALYRIRDLGAGIDDLRGPEAALLQSRLALLEAEVAGDAGRRDIARQALERF